MLNAVLIVFVYKIEDNKKNFTTPMGLSKRLYPLKMKKVYLIPLFLSLGIIITYGTLLILYSKEEIDNSQKSGSEAMINSAIVSGCLRILSMFFYINSSINCLLEKKNEDGHETTCTEPGSCGICARIMEFPIFALNVLTFVFSQPYLPMGILVWIPIIQFHVATGILALLVLGFCLACTSMELYSCCCPEGLAPLNDSRGSRDFNPSDTSHPYSQFSVQITPLPV